jgi:signal transduction histidine kinase
MQKQHCNLKLAVLLSATVALYALELHLAFTSDHKLSDLYFLPFITGMGLLPLRSLALLGGVLWGLAAVSSQLGADVVHGHSGLKFLVETVAITLCLWACRLRCQLDQSRELVERMQRHAPVGIALLDQEGRISHLNPAMLKLLGRSQEELVGQPWEAFSSHKAEPCASRCQQLRSASGWRHVEVACSALPARPSSPQQQLLVQALDCQQRIESQEALEAEQRQLQQSLKTSLLASSLVHEIKQPLAALLLQCRQLLFKQEAHHDADDPLRNELTALLSSAEQLQGTVRAVGMLLRSDGRPPQHPLDLSGLVRSCLEAIAAEVTDLQVNLVQTGLEQPLLIWAEQSSLQILVANLLRNALEALERAPIGQRHLAVVLRRLPTDAELTVSDSGSGLPSTDLSALQLRSSKTTGMGLGLLTAETIATQQGGSLRADRCPQLGGAALCLNLPLGRVQERADSGAAPPDAPAQNH